MPAKIESVYVTVKLANGRQVYFQATPHIDTRQDLTPAGEIPSASIDNSFHQWITVKMSQRDEEVPYRVPLMGHEGEIFETRQIYALEITALSMNAVGLENLRHDKET